jgi:hypothetical protein
VESGCDIDGLRNTLLKFTEHSADINIVRALLPLLAAMLAFASDRSFPRSAPRSASGHTSRYCQTCQRTSSGRIRRSASARRAFKESHPCPATGSSAGACPGFVIDHIKALKHGGSDTP